MVDFYFLIANLLKYKRKLMINNLLVPGGLGFIGSHTIIELFKKTKTNIIIVDDMSNCFDDVLDRIKKILSAKVTK
jgi:UDP-glucose 4-epimerase